VDSHNFPNLALMKLSAYHKARGDKVEWYFGELKYYDIVYMSKVFDTTYSPDMTEPYINVGKVIKGGTGYGLDNQLPDEIEHMMPDYGLYGITKTAYGFLTRGCPRACPFCIVAKKEGRKSVKVADLAEWWNGQKEIKLLDPNILACREHPDLLKQLAESGAWVDFTQGLDARLLTEDNINALNAIKTKMIHFAWDLMAESEAVIRGLTLYKNLGVIKDDRKLRVYVLTNYNTTMDENLYRIYYLRELGYDPYVMIYDKPNAPKEIKRLQRWVNNKFIWRSCERFDDYIA
jgi:hypothetical protein